MTSNDDKAIKGYRTLSVADIALVNKNKVLEEKLLRLLDQVCPDDERSERAKWRAIARTHIQQGFMAWNRALMQPQRIAIEDEEDDGHQQQD